MKTKTTNPHAWFFAYLKTVDGWGQGYDDDIKGAIISDYSGKQTESLKELFDKYPRAYNKMRAELSTKTRAIRAEQDEPLDKARKGNLKANKVLELERLAQKSGDASFPLLRV